MSEREVVKNQQEYDREQLEEVAEALNDMANSLSSQSAIDSELPRALHSLSGDIYDSLPHTVEVNRSLESDGTANE